MKRIFLFIVCLNFVIASFSQYDPKAKLLKPIGTAWEESAVAEGNDYNKSSYKFIKGRLGYLCHDPKGGRFIKSIQRVTYAEGSAVIDAEAYDRRTCLSVSYDPDWVDPGNDITYSDPNYPAIVYAYSVDKGDGFYDVFFYVHDPYNSDNDDTKPLITGNCIKLFKTGSEENAANYEDLSGLAWWYFSGVTSFSEMFSQDSKLKKIGLYGDFSDVTNITSMFANCNSLSDVVIESTSGEFGTSLTDMSSLFSGCTSLKTLTLEGNFSNVKYISSIFSGCTNLTSVTIGNFGRKLEKADNAFLNCSSITSATIGDDGDADVMIKGDFSNSKITTFANLFKGCYMLENAEIKGTFSSLTNVSSLFEGCSALSSAQIDFEEDALTNMANMFKNCTSITSATIGDGDDADVTVKGTFSSVSTLESLFNGCSLLEDVEIKEDFPLLTKIGSLFANCPALKTVDIDGDFSSLTSLASLFSGRTKLENVTLKGDFSKVESLKELFLNCSSLSSATLDADFESVKNLQSTFFGCTVLPSVSLKGTFANVTTTENMFRNCTALTNATLEGEFGDALTSMKYMFGACKSLKRVSISDDGDGFDVSLKGTFSSVSTLESLFNGCSILEDVEIKEDFPLLTKIGSLFANSPALKTVDIEGTFSSLTSLASLFSGKKNLEKAIINGSFDELTTMQEMFKDCDKIETILFNTDGDADVKITGTFPKLESMNGTFRDCDKLSTASLAIPASVTNLNNLFKSSKLTSASVSNVVNVTTMESMFSSCSSLTDVTLSGDFSKVTTVKEIFNSSTAVSSVSLNNGDADFTSLTSVENMVNNWDISKFDLFASIFSQMKINSEKLPGAKNGSHKITTKTNWTDKTVTTKNLAEYGLNGGYLATFLPIELTYFEVLQNGNNLFFEWETATETNNDYFTIEQSIDGVSFHEVAYIPGAGTSSVVNEYEYSLTTSVEGLIYFRLKQTDYNGDYSYSDVKSVFVTNNDYLRLYPVPAKEYITIEGDYESVEFVDMNGVIHTPHRAEGNTYPLSSLPKGMHYAIISMKNGEIVTRKFLKN